MGEFTSALCRRVGRKLRGELRLLKRSEFVDVDWYLATYPDVAEAEMCPTLHYLEHGASEGRNPNSWFDTEEYLRLNPDVRLADTNPAVHYVLHGREEGRATRSELGAPSAESGIDRLALEIPDNIKLYAAANSQGKPDLFKLRVRQTSATRLMVAHAENPEELIRGPAVLARDDRTDVIVTTTWSTLLAAISQLRAEASRVTVLVYPDGYGTSAIFVHLAESEVVWKYNLMVRTGLSEQEFNYLSSDDDRISATFGREPDLALCSARIEPVSGGLCDAAYKELALWWLRLGRDGKPPRPTERLVSPVWIRPFLLRHLAAAGISSVSLTARNDAQRSRRELALDSFLSLTARDAGMKCATAGSLSPRPAQSRKIHPKVVAFYLPQFHRIPENDLWWGTGFTEWNNVTRARQLFRYHWQPRIPTELGYYDLSVAQTRQEQAELARQYGLHGFCYYYYWFNGKKLLQKPIESVLSSGQPDLPFCICWANENWTRTWDGQNSQILLEQSYSLEGNRDFIREIIPMMKDPRYIRHESKPVLVVYRISIIPDWLETAEMWREECRKAGVGEIHLCAVRFTLEPLEGPPANHGLDAYVMFQPHESRRKDIRGDMIDLGSQFHGELFSYDAVVDGDLERFGDGYPWPVHRGSMLGWDNTARRGEAARIFHGATPARFRFWMKSIVEQEERFGDATEPLLFVNAWNEWAEGTVLEPERRYGRGFLEAIASVLGKGN